MVKNVRVVYENDSDIEIVAPLEIVKSAAQYAANTKNWAFVGYDERYNSWGFCDGSDQELIKSFSWGLFCNEHGI